ncbi:MAG: ATP-grasp domain-containing protein [Pseudomonadales bacterium]|jgi:biotin carboxylase|nr:ATP-grasp domain-containing protein [Pseudomonadales bacterium]
MDEGEGLDVFVVALDDFHLRELRSIRDAERYRFHGLLSTEEAVTAKRYDVDALLEHATEQLERCEDGPDGLVGHWDFPTTSLVPILGRRFGLRVPPLEATLRCEHKYWSRLAQARVVPELVPGFALVDPFAEPALADVDLDPPFWIKPVKAFSSYLGFHVRDETDFAEAMRQTREGLHVMAEPFDRVLEEAGPMGDVPAVNGWHCIAEQLVDGRQCTLEGYVEDGETVIYGVVDSVRADNRSSFLRYEYPSTLAAPIQRRMAEATRSVMEEIGYDHGCFNIEFFVAEDESLKLLELNPRMSKSHCPLFRMVEGASHHEAAVEIAVGRTPAFPRHAGEARCAAKCMIRRFEDGVVEHVADEASLQRWEEAHPGVHVEPRVEPGQRLSTLPPQDQDSYSFETAVVFVGGEDRAQLARRFQAALEVLDLRYADGRGDSAAASAPDAPSASRRRSA